jgi:hypothetical protein
MLTHVHSLQRTQPRVLRNKPVIRFHLGAESQRQKIREILRGPVVQPKLKIGAPNDKYEQEANRVAEQVMRMPEPQLTSGDTTPDLEEDQPEDEVIQTKQIAPLVQRQESVGEEDDEELIQTKTTGGVTPEVTPAISAGIRSLRGGGRALSRSERSFFEPRFGRDFSEVRVHSDARAANLARSIHARAFTFGHDIALGAGEQSADTLAGKKLLAHELTHVVQQFNPSKLKVTSKEYSKHNQLQIINLGRKGRVARAPTNKSKEKKLRWTYLKIVHQRKKTVFTNYLPFSEQQIGEYNVSKNYTKPKPSTNNSQYWFKATKSAKNQRPIPIDSIDIWVKPRNSDEREVLKKVYENLDSALPGEYDLKFYVTTLVLEGEGPNPTSSSIDGIPSTGGAGSGGKPGGGGRGKPVPDIPFPVQPIIDLGLSIKLPPELMEAFVCAVQKAIGSQDYALLMDIAAIFNLIKKHEAGINKVTNSSDFRTVAAAFMGYGEPSVINAMDAIERWLIESPRLNENRETKIACKGIAAQSQTPKRGPLKNILKELARGLKVFKRVLKGFFIARRKMVMVRNRFYGVLANYDVIGLIRFLKDHTINTEEKKNNIKTFANGVAGQFVERIKGGIDKFNEYTGDVRIPSIPDFAIGSAFRKLIIAALGMIPQLKSIIPLVKGGIKAVRKYIPEKLSDIDSVLGKAATFLMKKLFNFDIKNMVNERVQKIVNSFVKHANDIKDDLSEVVKQTVLPISQAMQDILRKIIRSKPLSLIRRKPLSNTSYRVDSTDPTIESILGRSSGKPLPSVMRATFEKKLATDLSDVRIHRDSFASEANKRLSARAFAYKNHIYFGRNQYDPYSKDGSRLIVHEVAHVVQEKNGARAGIIRRETLADWLAGKLKRDISDKFRNILNKLKTTEKGSELEERVQNCILGISELARKEYNKEKLKGALRSLGNNKCYHFIEREKPWSVKIMGRYAVRAANNLKIYLPHVKVRKTRNRLTLDFAKRKESQWGWKSLARRKLRRNLGGCGGNDTIHAHHVVPLEASGTEMVKWAAKKRWDINAAENGKCLEKSFHQNLHNRNYNSDAKEKLSDLKKLNLFDRTMTNYLNQNDNTRIEKKFISAVQFSRFKHVVSMVRDWLPNVLNPWEKIDLYKMRINWSASRYGKKTYFK